MGKAKAAPVKRRGSGRRRTTRTVSTGARPRWQWGLLVAVVAVVLARLLIFDAYRIASASMEDSLRQDDLVLVERLSFGGGWLPSLSRPQVGDVVVLRRPEDGGVMIKRCVAVAGQSVQIARKILYIDGERATDPSRSKYVDAGIQDANTSRRDFFGPLTVPADHIFVLGDNRDQSRDSRFFGPVAEPLLIGRAVVVLWPATVGDGSSRWSRLLSRVD